MMRSPTSSTNLSFHSTLALAPVQPIFPRRAPSLRPSAGLLADLPALLWAGKSCVLTLLRTLFLSLRSFSRSRPLFSTVCALFDKNTRGMGTSANLRVLCAPLPEPRSVRYPLPIDFLPSCFHTLTNCFSRNSRIFTTIRVARGCHPQ